MPSWWTYMIILLKQNDRLFFFAKGSSQLWEAELVTTPKKVSTAPRISPCNRPTSHTGLFNLSRSNWSGSQEVCVCMSHLEFSKFPLGFTYSHETPNNSLPMRIIPLTWGINSPSTWPKRVWYMEVANRLRHLWSGQLPDASSLGRNQARIVFL